MKKWIITGLIVLAAGASIFIFSRGAAARNQAELLNTIETSTVDFGTLFITVGASGQVRAKQSATLTWETSGQIEQRHYQKGDRVEADAVILSLEQTSLAPNVILAQADLVNAQKALDTLYASQVQQANALKDVDAAQKELEDARNPVVAQAEAQAAIAQAKEQLAEADRHYKITVARPSQAEIDRAYGSILLAEEKLQNTLETIDQLNWRYTSAGAGLPDFLKEFKVDIRQGLKKALEGLEIQRASEQIALNNAKARYENLLAPPDPDDVVIAETAIFAAQAQLDDALRQWERIKDGTSPAEIAVLEAKLADAQREWERIKDGPTANDIQVLEAQITAAQAAISQAAIRAPFTGVLTEIQARPGDQVQIGDFAIRIDDISEIFVDMYISEVDINQIKIGQDVVLTFEGILAKNYTGTVQDVALVGTNLGGVVSFKVAVQLLDADEDIRPGMKAEANVIINQKENALLIPNRAIRVLNGEKVVYVFNALTQQMPRPIVIELGESSNIYSELLAGNLEAGDTVLINPSEEIIALIEAQNQP